MTQQTNMPGTAAPLPQSTSLGAILGMKDRLFQATASFYTSSLFAYLIIAAGIALRFAQYQFNRALWHDEAALSLNIINRSFTELLQPLDFNQGAPVGFLMLEKLATQLFGTGEYALRLVPFLSAVAALLLFYYVAKRYLTPLAVPLALIFFTIAKHLIYYASDVKQYSSDVTVALVLYLVAVYVVSQPLTTRRIALLAGVGAGTLWFSHPALFVLGGVGIGILVYYLEKRDWDSLKRLAAIFIIWGISLVLVYLVSLRGLSTNEYLRDYWQDAYLPLRLSLSTVEWVTNTFMTLFTWPLPFVATSAAAVLAFIIGCAALYSTRKERFFIFVLPIFFTLIASGLALYPFSGRLILFLTPSMIMVVALGLEEIISKTGSHYVLARLFILALFLFTPLRHIDFQQTREEIRPVLSYLQEHRQDGDVVYIQHGAKYAFLYYADAYDFREGDYIMGIWAVENPENYAADIDQLRGHNRVWVLFSLIYPGEDELFVNYLDGIGTLVDSFKETGAMIYLYDLSARS